MSPERQVPEVVKTYVDAAREYVRRAVGVELDGSEESLAFVDHYVGQTRAGGPVKDDVLHLAAAALGAYFGEVVLRSFGGRWVLEPEPARWRVELDGVPLHFFPVGMAATALAEGEVAGYDASFATGPELTGPLGDALSAVPPVEESYYYSLTGRLETLHHAADVLVELERQKRADAD